jgi:biopolymer transport protein ExbB/TolQ
VTVPPTTDVLLLALAVLIAFVVAARSYMAWHRLMERAEQVRLRAASLDERATRLADTFAGTRTRVSEVNGTIDHALESLSRFDESAARWSGQLAGTRLTLEDVRRRHLAAAGEALARARRVGRVVMTALRLRRSLQV